MDDPDGGSVHIAGQRISHRREPERARIRARHIGMLFQNAQPARPPHRGAEPGRWCVPWPVAAGRADRPDVLGLLGLSDRAAAYPGQLSGGELARAGLAIALANAPPLLLADEPTGELDSATESRVLDLLSEAAARRHRRPGRQPQPRGRRRRGPRHTARRRTGRCMTTSSRGNRKPPSTRSRQPRLAVAVHRRESHLRRRSHRGARRARCQLPRSRRGRASPSPDPPDRENPPCCI